MKKLPLLFAVIVAVLAFAAPASVADTVTISGRAYAFNHMSTYLSGAVIPLDGAMAARRM